jgi:hypothetical protein
MFSFLFLYKVTSACSWWNETKLISLKNKHIYLERLEPANKILIQGKQIQKLKKQMKLCPIETDRFQKVSQKTFFDEKVAIGLTGRTAVLLKFQKKMFASMQGNVYFFIYQ